MMAGELPSKTMGTGTVMEFFCCEGVMDFFEVDFAFVIGKEGDLEGTVGFDEAAGVVVDGFAGAGEQTRGGVVIAKDHLEIGLGALECDADGDLAQRAAPETRAAADGLRAENEMDAEGTDPCRTRRSMRPAASWESLSRLR